MRVLILGGTGPSGLLLIQTALAASHTVIIYARSPHKLPESITSNTSIIVIKGELTDADELSKAMETGVHAVISALGPQASLMSWKYPRNTPLAEGYKVVLEVMKRYNVKRLIALGTPSMKDPNDKFDLVMKGLITGVAVGANGAYRDIVAIGEVIRGDEELLWTIARVPLLTNDEGKEFVVGYVGDGPVKGKYKLSRAAWAAFVVGELEKNEWVKAAPLVTSP
ncbi:hypothetical protein JAAARDRAFT_196226 [Jaapia argillacea MUCL 33604]|uniref:NAD(P)-binding domain-containing protein n=1 Tax=Jaapia argillacea MUCL 33604 TaxID=933084 RepID=A0A067PJ30_9AGAM|nr:hypothetical protein JAAARDRAFT_196226 [Jaapia argillacea MUCL 33604]